ncbi:hypothetical protein [Helicobacter heilmannii]|uniref:Uncharacterized protein n=1 Tax=Helicobacter heilmannii TaxID=35817 RepID=A0A0K2XKW1_HELHE|nr:hypothetical protein [Helicobacter heilmannii]CCM12347.1 hypothetical protein BN341_8120 [Helicobacter heilmannii ASB1.4]CRF46496.1 hypothetical protein HHE014_15070 [Helicobacter heilmannii]CRF47921.1 hypothetical protein HHE02_12220 [Helicobacter heilmannii]CRF48790.1 hypothetical protein HHE03_03670 [Helicobacter heilmannii]CRF50410.1 hypothetical protein HHE06_02350 [Helicobacter heilmannii]
MFSIDTKSIGIALALAILLGALGALGWYCKKILVESETCRVAVAAQNKAILDQNLATAEYVEKLQKSKDAIAQKYRNHTLPPLSPSGAKLVCAKQDQELKQIAQDLQVFKGGR